MIESLKEYGYVTDRPLIGVNYQFIDETTSYYYRIPVGVYITGVITENAERAGLQQGDVITAMNDAVITSVLDYELELNDCAPGDEVTVTIMRPNGDTYIDMDLKVTLSE